MATKKRIVNRPKTGIYGAPMDNFRALKKYFQVDVDKKAVGECFKSYVNSNYKKDYAQAVLANPEYHLTMYSHFGAIAFWLNSKLEMNDDVKLYEGALKDYIVELYESGKSLVTKKTIETTTTVPKVSPQERLVNKIGNTIIEDLYVLEDQWNSGEKTTLDIYTQFKIHGLSGASVEYVRSFLQKELDEYIGSIGKGDAQLVEGYSHLTKTETNRRIKELKAMISDLDRVKSAAKAIRKPRMSKPKPIDKQIAKVQYKKEDSEFKVVSLSPAQIIGRRRLYAFNTKTRSLVEYFTDDVNGFQISGTSIKNFDKEFSRVVKLRKPETFIPLIQSKTPKQIGIEWAKLTTKTTVPNGRLNSDTVLLRVLDK